jgi:hypothetical protein
MAVSFLSNQPAAVALAAAAGAEPSRLLLDAAAEDEPGGSGSGALGGFSNAAPAAAVDGGGAGGNSGGGGGGGDGGGGGGEDLGLPSPEEAARLVLAELGEGWPWLLWGMRCAAGPGQTARPQGRRQRGGRPDGPAPAVVLKAGPRARLCTPAASSARPAVGPPYSSRSSRRSRGSCSEFSRVAPLFNRQL